MDKTQQANTSSKEEDLGLLIIALACTVQQGERGQPSDASPIGNLVVYSYIFIFVFHCDVWGESFESMQKGAVVRQGL
jgi:hypothetical protein